MPTKIIAVLAALLLVAACESKSDVATTQPNGPGSVTAATPGSQGDFTQNVGDHTFFEYDSFGLTPQARDTLTKQAAWLKQYGQWRVTVEGHCDERGTREYNLALGERRASAIRAFLVAQGIPANRVRTISYGKERPEVLGSDESSYAKNRRGVTVLSN
ncbi:MAG: peptidoglycan-associated lipoprotein Pal [Rhodospirillales bacterium]